MHIFLSIPCSQFEYKQKCSHNEDMEKTVFTPVYRALIYWLVAHRKSQGLTVRDLAKRLGVVHSFVGRVETFERKLDVLEFVTYCHALNLDPKQGIDILLQDNNNHM